MSFSSLNLTSSMLSPYAYTVLSSAKFVVEDSLIKKKMSLINMLNKSGPRTEPWGTPDVMLSQELYDEPTLHLCFLLVRKLSNICI